MRYQYNYTNLPVPHERMYDLAERENRATKILAVLQDHLNDLSQLRLLDMSCSTGIMAKVFAQYTRKVVGIDIDESAIAFAQKNFSGASLFFEVKDAMNTYFSDGCFDIVVCNQMYEHVPDAHRLFREIYRVLTPGGVCYFGATNRLNIIETHYGSLPFLSWLPKPLAHLYLRFLGRARYYYENHATFWSLRRMVRNFEVIDYTMRVVEAPETFKAEDLIQPGSHKQRMARLILKRAYWLFPGYIWLLKKPVISG